MVSQLQFLATLSLVDNAAGEESIMTDFAASLRLGSTFKMLREGRGSFSQSNGVRVRKVRGSLIAEICEAVLATT